MLSWNQKEETLRCLAELIKVKVKGYKLEIVLIDNGSKDGTARAVKKNFPKIYCFINKANCGFAAGVNKGLRHALRDKQMEYVLLLNNDTFLNKTFLFQLIKTARSSNGVGIVAPSLKHYQKDELFFGMEGKLNLKTGKAKHRNIKKIKSKELIEAGFVSGCCMLIKREVVEKIGFFDKRYFLYLEDVDYCLRAKKAGYRIVLDPKVVIGHKVSAAWKNPLAKLPHSFKSNIVLILKWTPFLYKPLAAFHCLLFYSWLAFIWVLPLAKERVRSWIKD